MEDKVTIIKTSEHSINPFRKIRIGDPYYFKDIERGKDVNLYKSLVCDITTTCCKSGCVKISELSISTEFGEFKQIEVAVFLGASDEQLEVYKSGKWYGEETLKNLYEFGCDTARFEIEVDGRLEIVHTGADGYYGELKHMKQHYGLILHLTFDGSLFSFNGVESLMDYLFVFRDKK